jgi:dihydrofolate synthase/folylpolyglutamate synthase
MKLPSWPDPTKHKIIDLGLDRVYELLARLDNPHLKLPPTIHVAGTNGKGSTIAFLNAILAEAGYICHRYTSPHLVDFNERIIIAGKQISDQYLNELLKECKNAALKKPEIEVTFFEGTTIAAFLAFSRIKADVLLLETGMGGRLDATNCLPEVLASIITPISIDHQEFLGKTLKKITNEKAGIIKDNCPVIISKQKKSVTKQLKEVALKKNSPIKSYQEDWKIKKYQDHFVINSLSNPLAYGKIKKLKLPLPSLAGNHQLYNASTAIMALLSQNKLPITEEQIKKAIPKATWPARLEKITKGKFFNILSKNFGNNFELILDGSHNEDGSKTIKSWIANQPQTITYLIFGMLKNRSCKKFLINFKDQINHLFAVKIDGEDNSRTAEEIAEISKLIGINSSAASDIEDAINKITKLHNLNKNCRIIICGSLYLAGVFLNKNNLKL